MPGEPKHPPIIPAYGAGALADLAASVAASLGIPHYQNALGFTPTQRACILLVDGLGWEQLRDHPAAAPFLSELARSSRPITAGFPSTTVTSLSSLCTGLPPGQHGMVGLQFLLPATGKLLNGLHWDKGVDPWHAQPHQTIYERAVADDVAAYHVAQGKFRGTGLTVALMRGSDFRPAGSMGALVAQAATALNEHSRALAVVYHGDLDGTGHVFGVGSDAWSNQLAHVDKMAEQLAFSLPSGTALYITGDHGMVDVPHDDRLDYDELPALREGVAVLGGEPRARQVYVRPGAAADVLAAWRETLGERAWVQSRDEAIKDGWFGEVDPAMADRIGDVIAAASGTTAIIATKSDPLVFDMYGMHGSLTPSEQLIPSLIYTA